MRYRNVNQRVVLTLTLLEEGTAGQSENFLKKNIDRLRKVCYTKITKGKKDDCYCVATVNLLGFQEKKNWSKKIKNL